MWGYFFGTPKQQKELPKKAIVDLREHIQLLNKKQAHLQTQIDQQQQLAKRYLTQGNKNNAKTYLKKKKMYESQLDKLQSQIDSLEQQLYSIENANLNLETLKAMKQGASAMKNIHKGLDLDKVDDTMDEIREQVELNQEISEAISKPLIMQDELDEDELDQELKLLESEQQQAQAQSLGQAAAAVAAAPAHAVSQPSIDLPSVPNVKLSGPEKASGQAEAEAQEDEEEDEDERALRELQAEMGL